MILTRPGMCIYIVLPLIPALSAQGRIHSWRAVHRSPTHRLCNTEHKSYTACGSDAPSTRRSIHLVNIGPVHLWLRSSNHTTIADLELRIVHESPNLSNKGLLQGNQVVSVLITFFTQAHGKMLSSLWSSWLSGN